LPQVKTVLAEHFAGRPINEQNLSDWRQGGFEEWLAHQDLLAQAAELAANRQELEAIAPGQSAAELLTQAITFRFGAILASQGPELDAKSLNQIRALTRLCQSVVKVRRCEQDAARLKIETQRWEQASAQKADEQAEALKSRQRTALAAPVWAALNKAGRVAQYGGGPCVSIAADYLAEIETCQDPAHFQSKVLNAISMPEILRQAREHAKNAPVPRTPAQAAMDMYEEFDEFLDKQDRKHRPVPPRSKPRSSAQKPAKRRTASPRSHAPSPTPSTPAPDAPDDPGHPIPLDQVPSIPLSPAVHDAIKANQG